MLGVAALRSIVNNGSKFELHRCALPNVIDLTGQLTGKETLILSRGLKVIALPCKTKFDSLLQLTSLLNATTSRQADGGVIVNIPPQPFSKRSLGPYVGLDAQVVITRQQPATTIAIPRLVHDPQVKRLQQLRDIGIFKPADKGAGLVYLLKAIYRRMGLKYVENGNYIEVTADNNDDGIDLMRSLQEEVLASGNELCVKLIVKLVLTATRERAMYFLIKLHKALDDEGLYKVRPIVDCVDTPLAAADKIAATFCRPLNKFMWTIASSSIDMVAAIHGTTAPPDVVFYTADVGDLYGNVPIEEGVTAIECLLNEFQIGQPCQRKLIVQILKITLRNNVFSLFGKRYRQVHGIPMGSSSAPIVADAWLFVLERPLLAKLNGILLFKRYRDDLFAMTENEAQATTLNEGYNNLHPRIKLESAVSRDNANVLDIRISKFPEDGSIRTGVYFKSTNSLPLLHSNSNHPPSVLRAAIHGRILNFVRICNNTADLYSAIFSLSSNATKYGYDEAFVLNIAHKTIESCGSRPWPYLKPKTSRPRPDYRESNNLLYVRSLQPLYDVARRRQHRLQFQFGRSTLRTLCRTKDQ